LGADARRLGFNGGLVLPDRILRQMLVLESVAEDVVVPAVLEVKPDGETIFLNPFVRLLLGAQDVSQADVRPAVFGVDADGEAVPLDRLVRLFLFARRSRGRRRSRRWQTLLKPREVRVPARGRDATLRGRLNLYLGALLALYCRRAGRAL
jgi:hypothetical protein